MDHREPTSGEPSSRDNERHASERKFIDAVIEGLAEADAGEVVPHEEALRRLQSARLGQRPVDS